MVSRTNRKLLSVFFVALMAVGLTSCALSEKPEPRIETQEVKVGVSEDIPDFEIPPKPDLPVQEIDVESFDPTNEEDLERLGKAYAISIHLLQKDNKKLRNLLRGFKQNSSKDQ